MNWGTPDTSWANYNTNVWNPGAVDVAQGNVLARVSSGYDTDQASDWKELKPPSVDLIYPDEGGSYTWYWGNSYNITWIATNNNGADSGLDISIFYIKDVNGDGTINAGDTTFMIAETTANDGSYNWTVPSGFTGYIWIYLVATGPENPMLNSGTVSGKIYDPIPIFIGPEKAVVPELTIKEIVAPEEIPPASREVVAEEPTEEVVKAEDTVMPEVVVETPQALEPKEVVIEAKVEEPAPVVVEAPVVEAPVVEAPAAEAPVVETPAVEVPSNE